MTKDKRDRSRMIFDVGADVQLAIRLKALKTGAHNADVLTAAISKALPQELAEARACLGSKRASKPRRRKEPVA